MNKEQRKELNIHFPVGEIDILEQSLQEYDRILLDRLLKDKTTGENIKWGTNDYESNGLMFYYNQDIRPELVSGIYSRLIQPRAAKSQEEQEKRTRDKAEVFTPSWICNKQNNLVDEAWFGEKDIFNVESGKTWEPTTHSIMFPNTQGRTWQDYVEDIRLEVACGEAPYLVSRYDTITGDIMPLQARIGLLDRKLRIVGENTISEKEWLEWAEKAVQSIYGYDFQGDNVLLARENVLYTFADYYIEMFHKEPDRMLLRKIANIIAWNIWQMDGINNVCPFNELKQPEQLTISMFMELDEELLSEVESVKPDIHLPCKVMDWKANKSVKFSSLIKE